MVLYHWHVNYAMNVIMHRYVHYVYITSLDPPTVWNQFVGSSLCIPNLVVTQLTHNLLRTLYCFIIIIRARVQIVRQKYQAHSNVAVIVSRVRATKKVVCVPQIQNTTNMKRRSIRSKLIC